MVEIYYGKDVIEKAFRELKGVSNIRPLKFWLKNRVEAHVFICYISYLLLSIFKMNLKNKNIQMSYGDALEELSDVYNIYFCDKNKKKDFVKTTTLNKNQEKIMKAVDPKIIKKGVLSL